MRRAVLKKPPIRIVSVLAASLLLCSSLSAEITNQDFEADNGSFSVATGWSSFGGNKWESVWDNTRHWTQGVSEIPSNQGVCGVYQIISVTTGVQYRLAVETRVNSTDLDSAIGVSPTGQTDPASATYSSAITSSTWTQVSVEFIASSNNVTVFLRGRNPKSWQVAGTWVYFDHVTIETLGQPGNQAPIAVAAGSPLAGHAPLTVSFDASPSSDPDAGDVLTFDWDFGDNSTAQGETVTHTYQSTGHYSVTLVVNDGHGGTDSDVLAVDVTEEDEFPPGIGPNLITNPSFEAGFSDGLAAGWQWWMSAGTGYVKQSSRLGRIGSGIYTGTNGFSQTVRLKPKTILLSDTALGHSQGLRTALPDALIIGRLYIDPQFDTYISDPEYYGRQHADNCYNHHLQKPGIDAWQGFNEPNLNQSEDQARRVGRFEKAFAERCHELGIKACVLNIAVGNPGDMNRMLLSEIVDCLAVADYVGYHAYGGINDQLMVGPEQDWFALRWRFYVDMYEQNHYRMPPVVYTECTTFYGWRGVFEPYEIRDDLIAFEAMTKHADPWSAGMCIFLVGSNSAQWDPWETADQPVVYEGCGDYNEAHPADAWDGLYSQQFGQTASGFTGGIAQVTSVVSGKPYRLDHSMKYETYGVNCDVAYHVGYDLTGQASNPSASSIVWSPDLIELEQRETDWWYEHALVLTATSPAVSIWFKASQAPGLQAYRVMVDAVSLRETDGFTQYVIADFDQDGDVDMKDFGHFQVCLTGNGIPVEQANCMNAKLDADSDVDQQDFGIFQRCLSGANIAAEINCANQ